MKHLSSIKNSCFIYAMSMFLSTNTPSFAMEQALLSAIGSVAEEANRNAEQLYKEKLIWHAAYVARAAEAEKTAGIPIPVPPLPDIDKIRNGELARLLREKEERSAQKNDANTQDENGNTALHRAVAKSDVEEIKELVRNGARLDVLNSDGRFAIHSICTDAPINVLHTLIGLGADPEAPDTAENTPLHYAAYNGMTGAIRALLEYKVNLAAQNEHGATAVHLAAYRGHIEALEVLLSKDEDKTLVYTTDNKGDTPLHYAAITGHEEIIKILVSHAANVESKSKNGCTALHTAAAAGMVGAITILLSKGADKRAVNYEGRTALHSAADSGKVESVKALLAIGVNRNAITKSGDTALHLAAANGHIEVVKILLAASVCRRCLNSAEKTELELAIENGHMPVVDVLHKTYERERQKGESKKERDERDVLLWHARKEVEVAEEIENLKAELAQIGKINQEILEAKKQTEKDGEKGQIGQEVIKRDKVAALLAKMKAPKFNKLHAFSP